MSKGKESLKYWQSFPTLTHDDDATDRTISGQYWNLVSLGVKIDLSGLMKDYTPSSHPPESPQSFNILNINRGWLR